MGPKEPTPAEKEMDDRDLSTPEERGEDDFPVEKGGLRHPRTEGKGGVPDPGEDS